MNSSPESSKILAPAEGSQISVPAQSNGVVATTQDSNTASTTNVTPATPSDSYFRPSEDELFPFSHDRKLKQKEENLSRLRQEAIAVAHFVAEPNAISEDNEKSVLKFLNSCQENKSIILDEIDSRTLADFCSQVKTLELTVSEAARVDAVKNYFVQTLGLMASRKNVIDAKSDISDTRIKDVEAAQNNSVVVEPSVRQQENQDKNQDRDTEILIPTVFHSTHFPLTIRDEQPPASETSSPQIESVPSGPDAPQGEASEEDSGDRFALARLEDFIGKEGFEGLGSLHFIENFDRLREDLKSGTFVLTPNLIKRIRTSREELKRRINLAPVELDTATLSNDTEKAQKENELAKIIEALSILDEVFPEELLVEKSEAFQRLEDNEGHEAIAQSLVQGEVNSESILDGAGQEPVLPQLESLGKRMKGVMRSALLFGRRLVNQTSEKVKPVTFQSPKVLAEKLLKSARTLGTFAGKVVSSINDGVSMVRDPAITKKLIEESEEIRLSEELGISIKHIEKRRGGSEEMLERTSTLKKIWLHTERAGEAYKNLDPKTKLAIGGALIGIGFFGGAPVAAVAYGGRVVLRGLGAVSAGKGAEEMYRKKAMSNWIYSASDSSLSEEDFLKRGGQIEKNAKKIKYGVMASAFLLGSLADIVHLFDAGSAEIISEVPASSTSQPETLLTIPAENLSLVGEAFSNTPLIPTESPVEIVIPDYSLISTPSPVEIVIPDTPFSVIESTVDDAPEVSLFDGVLQVVSGQGITEALLNNKEALEMLTGGVELTNAGIKNYLANILGNLSPEQLKEVGIMSGNADVVSITDKVNVKKLTELANEIKVQLSGSVNPISILERAKMIF